MAALGPENANSERDGELGLAKIFAVAMPNFFAKPQPTDHTGARARRGDLSNSSLPPAHLEFPQSSHHISNPFARLSAIEVLNSLSDLIYQQSKSYFSTPLAPLFSDGFYLCPVANSQKAPYKNYLLTLSARALRAFLSDREKVASLNEYSRKGEDQSFIGHLKSLQYFVSATFEPAKSSERIPMVPNPRLQEFYEAGQFLRDFFSFRQQIFESEILGLVGLIGKSGEIVGSIKALYLYKGYCRAFTEKKANEVIEEKLEWARGLLEKEYPEKSALSDNDLGRALFRLSLMEELAERDVAPQLYEQIKKGIIVLFESMNQRAESREVGFDSQKALYLRKLLVDAVDADLLVSQLVLIGRNTNHPEMKNAIAARENSFENFQKEFTAHFQGLRVFKWVEPVAVTDRSLYDLRQDGTF